MKPPPATEVYVIMQTSASQWGRISVRSRTVKIDNYGERLFGVLSVRRIYSCNEFSARNWNRFVFNY